VKTVLVMRHGKSSWRDAQISDHDRPLKKRGRRDARRIGELLVAEGLEPDLVLSSSAERARRTAELVAEACGLDDAVILDEGLYHAEAADIVRALSRVTDRASIVLVTGHNPGLEALVTRLTDAEVSLPTAALAHVTLPVEHWRDAEAAPIGSLHCVWRPRELP
jgi:phosphohistidine phosphatase